MYVKGDNHKFTRYAVPADQGQVLPLVYLRFRNPRGKPTKLLKKAEYQVVGDLYKLMGRSLTLEDLDQFRHAGQAILAGDMCRNARNAFLIADNGDYNFYCEAHYSELGDKFVFRFRYMGVREHARRGNSS